MNKIVELLGWPFSDEGQTLIEYMLVLVLMALVIILMLTGLGVSINNSYSQINSSLPM